MYFKPEESIGLLDRTEVFKDCLVEKTEDRFSKDAPVVSCFAITGTRKGAKGMIFPSRVRKAGEIATFELKKSVKV